MAAAELFRMRADFVQGVNDEVINEILDDLLRERVLNRGEKASILGVNVITPEKARRLIDTVTAKKDAASLKMIVSLKNRDPTLYSSLQFDESLEEAPPQAALPAEAPKPEWSDTLIPSSETFWREKQMDDKNVYPAFKNTLKKRVALMITNIEFTDKKLNRRGADADERNMAALLKALRYEVVKYRNCTAKQIDKAVKEFSQHEKLRDTDSVIVVIMSHGLLGQVLGVDYKDPCGDEEPDLFPIANICKHLNTLSCPALEDKPKVIMIQACRGGDSGSFLICDAANQLVSDAPQQGPSPPVAGGNLEEDHLRYVPSEQEFIFMLSSTPNNKSYRDPVDGSVLIQAVCKVFKTYAHNEHIDDLFRRVTNYCVETMKGSQLQVPSRDRCTLSKKFYLFPGI